MPHISDDDKIIICCHDLAAGLGGQIEMLRSIEAGIQLRASKDEHIDHGAATELIALAESTMAQVLERTEQFHDLRDQLFGFDDHD